MDGSGQDPLIRRLFPDLSPPGDWTPERVRNALHDVGDPHHTFASVLVGGTNGKGSVVAIVEAVLRRGGHRTGRYVSPHLISFPERIQVGGRPLTEDRLLTLSEPLHSIYARHRLSFFEAATVLSFLAFAEEGVEIAVVEVGLGGRLDATNVLDPLVTAVTNISLDHTHLLGDDVVSIAKEKAGIARRAVPFFTTVGAGEVGHALREEAERRGAEPIDVEPDNVFAGVRTGPDGLDAVLELPPWKGEEVSLPLLGEHQRENLALAVSILSALPSSFVVDRQALTEGLRETRWPGRLDRRRIGSTTWLFDVAHNPEGTRSLATYIRGAEAELPRPRWAVVGILRDKPWRTMLNALEPHVDGWVVTVPSSAPLGRSWDPDIVADSGLGVETRVEPDVGSALRTARSLAGEGTVVVTGSSYTVGDALGALKD